MKEDVNVSQVSELRVFAKTLSVFGEAFVSCCQQGISECDNAYQAAEFWRNMVRRKVEEARARLESARKAYENYENQSHEDSEGNSTYDSSYAAQLLHDADEAQYLFDSAKHDEDLVIERYIKIKQETDTIKSDLSLGSITITENARNAFEQVSLAARHIERYNSGRLI